MHGQVIVLLIGIWCMLKLVGDIALWIGPSPKDCDADEIAHADGIHQSKLVRVARLQVEVCTKVFFLGCTRRGLYSAKGCVSAF